MRKKSPVRNSKNHKKMNKALLAVLAVLFTGFLTCVIIGSYVLFDVIRTVNGDRLIDLEFYKQNQDQTTIIYANDAENNPVELARLHGGDFITETTLASAEEQLAAAEAFKKRFS